MTEHRFRVRVTALLATSTLAMFGFAGGSGAAPPPETRCTGYVGLTYDDGPTATTDRLLAALHASRLRATFFDQGNNALAWPTQTMAEANQGMWVGNHSTTNPHLTQIEGVRVFEEIATTQWVLRDLTGQEPALFRPPYGETNDLVRGDEDRIHLLEVLWTVDSRDSTGASAAQIAAAAHTVQPGGIIQMHDGPPATIAAVPLIAKDLSARSLCPGRIAYTPREVPFGNLGFHAEAVRP
jgi:peptidoglycan/xylan/chitin deacetylase (PgdA/CDA1 family)